MNNKKLDKKIWEVKSIKNFMVGRRIFCKFITFKSEDNEIVELRSFDWEEIKIGDIYNIKIELLAQDL